MKPRKEVAIVVGIVKRAGDILLIQRKDKNPMWDKKWEFPGGKIEPDERPDEAIHREVLEETGLVLSSAKFLQIHEHDWEMDALILHVTLHCYECLAQEGKLKREEEKSYQLQWIPLEQALGYNHLQANKDILENYVASLRGHA